MLSISSLSLLELARAFKLAVIEIGVETIFRHQLIMRALLYNIAVIHTQNAVRITDGRQAMCNNKAGPPLHQVIHRLLDEDFRPGINT